MNYDVLCMNILYNGKNNMKLKYLNEIYDSIDSISTVNII